MVHVSSFSSPRWYATGGIYGGTKRFNHLFGNLVSDVNRKKPSSSSIDSIILLPGLVTTPMTSGIPTPWYNTCSPEQTVRGTLHDLGYRSETYGSPVHMAWGIQIYCTPEWLRNMQRSAEGTAKFGEYGAWLHL